MAAVMSEDHLLCCICLEVFTDPVFTPCGHNFCKSCISQHWDNSPQCQCPLCNEIFNSRPQLRVNTLVSEMVSQVRSRPPQVSVRSDPLPSADEVLCDVCQEPKARALKTCLVCLLSYCPLHLQPHQTVSRLNQLTEPVENLEERMCPKHDKPLELFCQWDMSCVCVLCSVLDHKDHHIVPLKEGYEDQMATLRDTQDQTEKMMEERHLKIQEVRESLTLSQKQAQTHMEEGQQIYKSLMDTVQKSMEQFKLEIEQKLKRSEEEAETWITDLEQEIAELDDSRTEMEQLIGSEDHLYFIQRVTSLKTSTDMTDWTQMRLETPSFEGSVNRAMDQLQTSLKEEFNKREAKETLKKLQQWAVDVTLDPNIAHPSLVLSEDLNQVYHDGVKRTLSDNQERFTNALAVLGKQSVSSGRFYFEVQVKGKAKWEMGLAKGSVDRKNKIFLKPQNGFWTIILKDGTFKACACPGVTLSLKSSPERIGVFVDYEQSLVSFYDVDTADLIYSFTGCTFTEKLYPFFNPGNHNKGKNLVPLCL